MTVPPSDFLKYLNRVIGAPANILAASPLEYDESTGNLWMTPANALQSGYVTTSAQDFAGVKNFLVPPTGVVTSSIQSTSNNISFDTSNTGSDVNWLVTGDESSSYANEFKIYGLGNNVLPNSEWLQIGYTPTKFELKTDKLGSGVIRNMEIFAPMVTITSSNNATDTLTGSLHLVGGASIATDLYVGGTIYGSVVSTTDNFSYAVGGAMISPNITGNYTKLSSGEIAMNFNLSTGPAVAAATIYTASGSIPVAYRPSVTVYAPISVMSDSLVKLGTIELKNDGTIILYESGHSDFANSGTCGVMKGSIIYKL